MKSLSQRFTDSCLLFFAFVFLLTASSKTPAQENIETVKVDTELVSLNVVALDRNGRRLSGLQREDFEVYEDGVIQEITHFTTAEDPLRLILLFDTSISMEEVLPTVKQEAARLVARLRPQDEISIVSFASDVNFLARWVGKTEAAVEIENLSAEAHPAPLPATITRHGYNVGDGNTYMYEALKYIFENVRGRDEKIAVIMFTDGVDTGAGRSMEKIKERAGEIGRELKWLAEESWVLVYPIRYKTKQIIGDIPEAAWRPTRAITIGSAPANPSVELLDKISGATGGATFEFQGQQDLTTALEKVLSDLRSLYSLAYRPPQSPDNDALHRIKVRVKRPGVFARTRVGYRRLN